MLVAPVSHWPAYLLKRVPEDLRSELSAEARERNVSLQDVIRQALCDRYHLNCPQASFRYEPDRDNGVSDTIHLRLQKKLKRALDAEASQSGLPLRTIIVAALEQRYG